MSIHAMLRSPKTAIVGMAFFVALGLVLGHRYAGWLGVRFVGIVGLVISMRAEMFEDYIEPTERTNGHSVRMHANYLEDRAKAGRDASPQYEAEAMFRNVMHRAVNAVLASVAVLGFGLHLLHD